MFNSFNAKSVNIILARNNYYYYEDMGKLNRVQFAQKITILGGEEKIGLIEQGQFREFEIGFDGKIYLGRPTQDHLSAFKIEPMRFF